MALLNTATAQQLFSACVAHGGAGWDHSGMVRALETMANFGGAEGGATIRWPGFPAFTGKTAANALPGFRRCWRLPLLGSHQVRYRWAGTALPPACQARDRGAASRPWARGVHTSESSAGNFGRWARMKPSSAQPGRDEGARQSLDFILNTVAARVGCLLRASPARRDTAS